MIKCTVIPPPGFDFAQCHRQLKQIVRARVKRTTLRRSRDGYFTITGPVPDLVLLKLVLNGFGYDFTR